MDPSFQKDFLRDFKRGNSTATLALFGKHPAWNDHMDDLGLATPSLRTCKRLLYLQGIAANAAREHVESTAPAPYRHTILWARDGEGILIRIVESADGRGRSFFPLVAAVHLGLADAERSLRLALPALRGFTDTCRSLTSRDAVLAEHRHAQDHLRAELRHPPATPPPPPAPPVPEEAEALRALASNSSSFSPRAVPICRYDPAEAFAALHRFWSSMPGSQLPLLVSQGDSDRHLTLASGEPSKTDFWFLRARE